eukprot:scaffold96103_cov98-Phaeocystis_antarctica.AAC.1
MESDGVRAWPPFVVSSSDWNDLRRPRTQIPLMSCLSRLANSRGVRGEVELISGELARSRV